jgi:hypothetical protein
MRDSVIGYNVTMASMTTDLSPSPQVAAKRPNGRRAELPGSGRAVVLKKPAVEATSLNPRDHTGDLVEGYWTCSEWR